MPPRDHFPGMVQLSPSVYLYTPSDQTYVPSDRSAPKLVILCAWMNASATHITKYIVGYQALFPTSSILLIRSSAPDILYRSVSTLRRRIEPALAVVQSTCSQEPSKPEILLHAFSNGGSHHAINLLRYHLSSTGQTLPLHAKVLDSCPGRGNFRRSYLALSAPFERQPLYIRLVGSILVVLTLCLYWVFMFSLRLENPIEAIRQELNDKSMSRETKRIYIYSDTDRMVHWKEVEDHAEDARNKGFMVELERFEGSEHASHVRVGGGERYWRIVKDLWQEQSKT